MTISRKLYTSFCAALAFTLILGITAWSSLTHIGNEISISSKSTRKLELAGEMGNLTGNMLSLERGMVVRSFLKDALVIEEYNLQFHDDAAKRQELLKEDKALSTSPKALQVLQDMLDSNGKRVQTHDEFYQLASQETEPEPRRYRRARFQ
ncbi:hypothetical protein HDF16_001936 [Granulicella aggregans]|uniref:Chemoreceptor-like protein with four helix bundle sensory module n=1 Tax=Granulicella aggregans TaxID=474949 RepID=A0A7W7ZDC0_9BACT|nr:hypothetical protein [Granulicella aggregans]MBB5057251.1 hypothetical protein [Granulicella aggregans]